MKVNFSLCVTGSDRLLTTIDHVSFAFHFILRVRNGGYEMYKLKCVAKLKFAHVS